MKIAMIGAGNVGGTLGSRWAKLGHEVLFGVRDKGSLKAQYILKSFGDLVKVVSIKEAAAGGEVVVLATPWPAAQSALAAAGNLQGKIVVDCTNPIAEGLKGLSIGQTTSAGERVAEWAKGARVVKAFNTTGTNNMADPVYGSQRISMLICGDDKEAKQTVAKLAEELGFEVSDAGPLESARYLEPLAMLWIQLAFKQGFGPNFAFRIVRR